MTMLVVVCGLPGVGKSTVAEAAAVAVDGAWLRTDEIRKELVGEPEYDEEETRLVYDELFDRAQALLAEGRPVVVDGTFRRAALRERAVDVAERAGVPWELLNVVCDPDVVRERIRARTDDPSDADVEVYELLRERFEPVAVDHRVVDNSGSVEETVARVEAVLDSRADRDDDGPAPDTHPESG